MDASTCQLNPSGYPFSIELTILITNMAESLMNAIHIGFLDQSMKLGAYGYVVEDCIHRTFQLVAQVIPPLSTMHI